MCFDGMEWAAQQTSENTVESRTHDTSKQSMGKVLKTAPTLSATCIKLSNGNREISKQNSHAGFSASKNSFFSVTAEFDVGQCASSFV
jgi:hypothetical protein